MGRHARLGPQRQARGGDLGKARRLARGGHLANERGAYGVRARRACPQRRALRRWRPTRRRALRRGQALAGLSPRFRANRDAALERWRARERLPRAPGTAAGVRSAAALLHGFPAGAPLGEASATGEDRNRGMTAMLRTPLTAGGDHITRE